VHVRYISHELRTPLNIASVGLNLLSDDFSVTQKSSTNPKDFDRYDTICDVSSACRTAVDILNDLLCFDKLESNILELHKSEVPVLPFISEGMSGFSIQARECGVTLLEADDADGIGKGLRESDLVFMDKFKMEQVLRNLLSNALKFTPQGGTVTVSATFVPNLNRTGSSSIKEDQNKPVFSKNWIDLSPMRWLGLYNPLNSNPNPNPKPSPNSNPIVNPNPNPKPNPNPDLMRWLGLCIPHQWHRQLYTVTDPKPSHIANPNKNQNLSIQSLEEGKSTIMPTDNLQSNHNPSSNLNPSPSPSPNLNPNSNLRSNIDINNNKINEEKIDFGKLVIVVTDSGVGMSKEVRLRFGLGLGFGSRVGDRVRVRIKNRFRIS
jgi:hypothetical protein